MLLVRKASCRIIWVRCYHCVKCVHAYILTLWTDIKVDEKENRSLGIGKQVLVTREAENLLQAQGRDAIQGPATLGHRAVSSAALAIF